MQHIAMYCTMAYCRSKKTNTKHRHDLLFCLCSLQGYQVWGTFLTNAASTLKINKGMFIHTAALLYSSGQVILGGLYSSAPHATAGKRDCQFLSKELVVSDFVILRVCVASDRTLAA